MITEGQKYHNNGKVYTVIKITRERCINGTTTIELEDSCGNKRDVTEMQLVTKYSGLIQKSILNNQQLTNNDA